VAKVGTSNQDHRISLRLQCVVKTPNTEEKEQNRKVGKPRLVTAVSAETASKSTYVIL
jgi:hypothetical protein